MNVSRKPPQKKAPWFLAAHGNQPLQKPRRRIRPVSPKRIQLNHIYAKRRKKFLAEHPWCAVYPKKRSTQVHHTAGRLGTNFLDVSTWLAVSMKGHERIHQVLPGLEELSGPKWATRMGYLKSFHS